MPGLHRRRKRVTTNDDYAAMLGRMIGGYGRRLAEDPVTALPHLRDLETAMSDSVNLGLYHAAQAGTPALQLADILGISRQAVYKRIALGETIARRQSKTRPAAVTAQVARPRELPPG